MRTTADGYDPRRGSYRLKDKRKVGQTSRSRMSEFGHKQLVAAFQFA